MNKYEYLLVLLVCFSFPLLFNIFHPKAPLKPYLKEVFLTCFLVSIPWLIWDVWATNRGHWGFNPDYYLGFKIINLPLEEISFFIIIPFCCVFVWSVIKEFTTWENFINQLLNKN